LSENNRSQIKITAEEFRYIALLNEYTNVFVRDCIVDEENNRIIYLVNPTDIAKAIGPKGIYVQKLRNLLNKDIEIIGYSEKLEEQAKYALAPAKVKEVKLANKPSGRKIIYVIVEPKDKGLAIGRNGRNVSRAKLVLKRYFNIDDVIII